MDLVASVVVVDLDGNEDEDGGDDDDSDNDDDPPEMINEPWELLSSFPVVISACKRILGLKEVWRLSSRLCS